MHGPMNLYGRVELSRLIQTVEFGQIYMKVFPRIIRRPFLPSNYPTEWASLLDVFQQGFNERCFASTGGTTYGPYTGDLRNDHERAPCVVCQILYIIFYKCQ